MDGASLFVGPLEVPLLPDTGVGGGGAGAARLGLGTRSGCGAGGRGRGGGGADGVTRKDRSDREMDASDL